MVGPNWIGTWRSGLWARQPPGPAVDITVTANGPRPRLHPEVLAGLRGEPLGEGLAGRWVQAFYVQAVTADGGGIAVQVGESEAVFRVRVPDD